MLHSVRIQLNISVVMGSERHADVFARRHFHPDAIRFDACVATLACRRGTRITLRSGAEIFARLR